MCFSRDVGFPFGRVRIMFLKNEVAVVDNIKSLMKVKLSMFLKELIIYA
jgi:hypothetical protein